MADYKLTVDILGSEELKKTLLSSSMIAKQALSEALNKTANDLRQKAVSKAPHKTGTLWRSIHAEYATVANPVAKVGTDVVYARAQEKGTVGMIIHSRSKRGKPFTYKGNIKPKWYMKQAKEEVKANMTNYLEQAGRNIISHIAGK
ncbi:MAG TPA: HK97 gp10 family phage protein [Chloroflexia bacterium]|nr:HK97 gp10 family phage protein [Chloroflexia bacterium]